LNACPVWSQKPSETASRRRRGYARTRPYHSSETVLSRTGLSRSTIYRKIAEGTFPAQLKISTNGTGWHESDINRWVADPVSWRPREFDEIL
jgi:prophage regulatory protein